MRQIRDAAVALLLFAGGALVGYQWCHDGQRVAESKPATITVPSVPDCAGEDDPTGPCFWDAATRGIGEGKGKGQSFYVDAEGRVYR
ncbi:hypothetical protein O7614_26785 [Micromonospora sp. WMMD961]|uniref:hypothetical protein n=1 Tax=Micromonospora sp. WMMD961 TaxID=3016100 RepID=UPI0024174D56|nr:hypothetical protein [Micromonospora sp. WMMD961]MDG4783271.1 hypothetical protein [Micromonospora sp. WMMD961]